MRMTLALCVVGLGLAAATPALAHHSFASVFDADQPVMVTGTVTKIEWQNPHAWFYIDVKNERGETTNWGLELGSPNVLLRAGWARDSLKVGDVVTVDAFRARNEPNVANATTIVLARTGQKLFAASSQPQPSR